MLPKYARDIGALLWSDVCHFTAQLPPVPPKPTSPPEGGIVCDKPMDVVFLLDSRVVTSQSKVDRVSAFLKETVLRMNVEVMTYYTS